MKISLDWLKDYIKLNKTATEIADGLTMGIAEVEEIITANDLYQGIVVGLVKEVKKHPNADRLSLAKVNIGNQTLKIICGANNLAEGQKVPVATIGSSIPNGMEIKKVEIRGIESCGMICSQAELGIEEESNGIMVLGKQAKIGQKFSDYLGKKLDFILEIDNKSLTHRSDLFGHIGIARELGAIFNKKIQLPKIQQQKNNKNNENIAIRVADTKKCPRYMAAVLDGVKIDSSPQWMQDRLSACGIKPINNVVDITNYVMLEYGQPLHAFDCNKLSGSKKGIQVRLARKNEKIKTLDGKQRVLSEKDLVIADKDKAIAIAGIMGGFNTQVDKSTNKIILEAANFDAYSVRKTAQRIALRTESLTRFEKGLSPYFAAEGLMRAISLLQEHARAKLRSKIHDTQTKRLNSKQISLDINKINQYIGHEIKIEKVKSIIKSLDFKISGTKSLKVLPPVYRNDINIPEDVIEEVARIYGYGNIKPQALKGMLKPIDQEKDIYWGNVIAEILSGLGMNEVMNYSFYGAKLLEKSLLTPKDHIELQNPISKDLKYLRTTLLPGLFKNAEDNIKKQTNINIFEIGHVYLDKYECKAIAGIMLGDNSEIYYRAKGVVETLFRKLNIDYKNIVLEKNNDCEYFNMYQAGTCLQYFTDSEMLGTMALTNYKINDNFDLKKKNIAFFSLSLDKIIEFANHNFQYRSLPKYPAVNLDLAILIKKDIRNAEIKDVIKKTGGPLLKKVELFDIYTGNKIGENLKNMAYHLEFRSEVKTLQDEEVEKIYSKIVSKLATEFGAKLRK